jgi:DNA-binding NarL/FixJ family response regulator
MTTTVVIAEDHPLYRDAIAALLSGAEDIALAGTTDTVEGLRRLASSGNVDVAVVDLHLADGPALPAFGDVKASGCRILVLTTSDDDATVYAALKAGAHGFLLKSSEPAEILRAIRTVAAGDGTFDGSVLTRITRHLVTGGRASTTGPFPQLTTRERDVLDLMARGMSTAEIADHYVLSLKTVRNHIANILTKLGTPSRAKAVVMAHHAGLGVRPD